MEFTFIGVDVGDIVMRADGNEHVLSVERKGHAAGEVVRAGRKIGYHNFLRTASLHVSIFIGITEDGVGVTNVDVLGVFSGRIESDAEGQI